jgi:hypothetical protein
VRERKVKVLSNQLTKAELEPEEAAKADGEAAKNS